MTSVLRLGTLATGAQKVILFLLLSLLLGIFAFFVFWAIWWLWPPSLFTKLLDASFWLPNVLGVHGELRYQHKFFGSFADGTPLYGTMLMPDAFFILYFLGMGMPWVPIYVLVKRRFSS